MSNRSVEDYRKHLEFIQAVISRLAGASFQIKGWATGLLTALLGVIIAAKLPLSIAFVGVVPSLLFWFLDAYYLKQERLFRSLYNDAVQFYFHDSSPVQNIESIPNPQTAFLYSMDVSEYKNQQRNQFPSVFFSSTVMPLHLVILLTFVLFGCATFVFGSHLKQS